MSGQQARQTKIGNNTQLIHAHTLHIPEQASFFFVLPSKALEAHGQRGLQRPSCGKDEAAGKHDTLFQHAKDILVTRRWLCGNTGFSSLHKSSHNLVEALRPLASSCALRLSISLAMARRSTS